MGSLNHERLGQADWHLHGQASEERPFKNAEAQYVLTGLSELRIRVIICGIAGLAFSFSC